MKNNHFHIIIAGGSGQRFWPLSRLSKPKQLLSLVHEKSLIRLTVDRIKSFSQIDNIFIVSNEFLAGKISNEIPELNKDNFIIEKVSANGKSFSKERKDKDGNVSKSLSRRVEFSIKTNDREAIEIINKM